MKYLRMVVLTLAMIVYSASLMIPNNESLASIPVTTVEKEIVVKSISVEPKEKLKTKKITYKDSLTPKTLFTLVKSVGVKHPEIITAQALEETGYFKSNIFKTKGNLFGMKNAGSRPTTSCNNGQGYADYKCHKDYILYSVMDRVMLDAAFYRNLSKESYYAKLSRTYASNPNYVSNLKKIIQKHGIHFNN